jgi:hypothetical protein
MKKDKKLQKPQKQALNIPVVMVELPKWKTCKNCDCGEFPVRRCDCGCHD